VQNVFFGDRTNRVNAHYLLLMKNPADSLQAMNLGRQLFPKKQQYFSEALADATREPHSYLLVDLAQSTADQFRLRTQIFPDDKNQIIYLPKKPL